MTDRSDSKTAFDTTQFIEWYKNVEGDDIPLHEANSLLKNAGYRADVIYQPHAIIGWFWNE